MKHFLVFSLICCFAIGPQALAQEAADSSNKSLFGGFFSSTHQIETLQLRFDEALSFYAGISPEVKEVLMRPENQGLLTRVALKLRGVQFKGLDQVARDISLQETSTQSGGDVTSALDALLKALATLSPFISGMNPQLGGVMQIILTILPVILEFIKIISGGGGAASLQVNRSATKS